MVTSLAARIGIGLSSDRVCAVIARGHEIVWSGVDNIDDQKPDAALTRMMARLPKMWWPKPQVHAGVSIEYAQVKTIRALPSVRDNVALRRIIAASPGRFFITTPGSASVTGVRVLEEGVARAAVVKNDAIGFIQEACAAKGLSLARVVPGEIALSALSDEELLDPCALGLGAAFVDRREPVVMRPARWTREEGSLDMRRLRLAGFVAAAAVVAALTIPTLLAKREAVRAHRELALIAPARARQLVAERKVNDAARMLTSVSAFERSRLSVTWLLGGLANALPVGTMILSLKVDSSTVTLSAISPSATEVVRQVQEMPGVSNAEIIGAITYDGAGTGSNPDTTDVIAATGPERVTIRFRLAPDPANLRVAFVGGSGGPAR